MSSPLSAPGDSVIIAACAPRVACRTSKRLRRWRRVSIERIPAPMPRPPARARAQAMRARSCQNRRAAQRRAAAADVGSGTATRSRPDAASNDADLPGRRARSGAARRLARDSLCPLLAMPKFLVLLVDDDPLVLRSIGRVLHLLGHDLEKAESVRTALEYLETMRFDLVLTDLRLGDGCGTEVIAAAALQGS